MTGDTRADHDQAGPAPDAGADCPAPGTPPHVTYFFDTAFAPCTLVSLLSVLRQTPGPIRVTLHPTEDPGTMARDLEIYGAAFPQADLRLEPVDLAPFRHLKRGRLPLAARSRLLLPEIHRGRVIYLDGDVIARRDLNALWQTDLQGRAIGACLAPGVQVMLAKARTSRAASARKAADKTLARGRKLDGIDMHGYFNSGVMLLDLDRIRARGLAEPMRDIEATARYTSRDQDWLNMVFRDDRLILPPEWNSGWGDPKTGKSYVPAELCDRFKVSREDPAIIHFTGFEKPWQAASAPWRWHLLHQPLQRRLRARYWDEYQVMKRAAEALLGRSLHTEAAA